MERGKGKQTIVQLLIIESHSTANIVHLSQLVKFTSPPPQHLASFYCFDNDLFVRYIHLCNNNSNNSIGRKEGEQEKNKSIGLK